MNQRRIGSISVNNVSKRAVLLFIRHINGTQIHKKIDQCKAAHWISLLADTFQCADIKLGVCYTP